MKRFLAGLGLLLAVACTQEPVTLTQVEVFRNPSAQIASQTDVTADRMAGTWFIRQRFANQAGPQFGITFKLGDDGALYLLEVAELCENDICAQSETLYLMLQTGPGRWKTQTPAGSLPDAELWVMWMDFDSRTAAIGTPSGEFGWIMDKSATGGGDRIIAARDIMEWFGYTIARLEEVRR